MNPAGTQRLKDVRLWSYFGRNIPDHHLTKIEWIRFLTYFASVISDIHLASKIRAKFFYETILSIMIKLTYWGCRKDLPRHVPLFDVFKTFLERSPKLEDTHDYLVNI